MKRRKAEKAALGVKIGKYFSAFFAISAVD
jgi:hypothetical protein